MMLDINFAKEKTDSISLKKTIYKILIVDDEKSIHEITKIVLSSMNFKDFKIKLFYAYSVQEAREVFEEHKDIALALIDVIMETSTAGLDLVNIIRNEYKNDFIRLIIRTGQADVISQIEVTEKYDINDFKEKTELTIEKLYTTVRNGIKQYIQLVDLQKKYEETYYQLTHNPLTKLPNRLQLSYDCHENKQHKALVLIDIVGFSLINDGNGFEVGDHVLIELGSYLQSMYSNEFKVYHLGQDLFALITKYDTFDNLEAQIKDIKEDISKLHIITDNFNKTINTTIGVACQNDNNLMRKAELALKEARENGKNKIQFYSDDLKIIQRIENTNLWASRIKDAIENDKLLVYYQKIVDTKSKKLVKYEALVRLEYEGEIYSPYHFLDAALYSGQMYDIFKVMFTKSCAKVQEINKKISINVTDSDILQDDFTEFIKSTIDSYGISYSLISLEILEYKSISEEVKDILNKIHDLGINILIDDFGIQCSNFGQLENLPVDILKIDGSFIKDIHINVNSQIIVKTILLYAKEKNIKLLAEFVCSKEVYEYVLALGIDYTQGYYIAEPSPEIVF